MSARFRNYLRSLADLSATRNEWVYYRVQASNDECRPGLTCRTLWIGYLIGARGAQGIDPDSPPHRIPSVVLPAER